jgi:hypothetical protein
MKTLKRTTLQNPTDLSANAAYLHEKNSRFAVHTVFHAGQTSNSDFDGWSWHATKEAALVKFAAVIARIKSAGFTQLAPYGN